jgi:hypothetical protein
MMTWDKSVIWPRIVSRPDYRGIVTRDQTRRHKVKIRAAMDGDASWGSHDSKGIESQVCIVCLALFLYLPY